MFCDKVVVFHGSLEQLHMVMFYTSCSVKHLVSNIDRCQRLDGRMSVVIDLHVQSSAVTFLGVW